MIMVTFKPAIIMFIAICIICSLLNDVYCVIVDFKRAGFLSDRLLEEILIQNLPEGSVIACFYLLELFVSIVLSQLILAHHFYIDFVLFLFHNRARLTIINECCRSGKGLGLPFEWSESTSWIHDPGANYHAGDVVMICACTNAAKLDLEHHYNAVQGIVTNALLQVLRANPVPSYDELVCQLTKLVRDKRSDIRPQLTTSQMFDITTSFVMNESRSNSNIHLTSDNQPVVVRATPSDPRLRELIGVTGSAFIINDIDLE